MVLFPKSCWDIEDLKRICEFIGVKYEITKKGNLWIADRKQADLVSTYRVCPSCGKIGKWGLGFVCPECFKKRKMITEEGLGGE